MRTTPATLTTLGLACLLTLPALAGDALAGRLQLPQTTVLVTAPLQGTDLRCHLVVVGPKDLGYRVQIFGQFGPLVAPLAEVQGQAVPGIVYFTSASQGDSRPAYCRIQLFGTKDKDDVRGALQATSFTIGEGGISESTASSEAR